MCFLLKSLQNGFGGLGCFDADIGDRGDLPKRAAGNGSDRKQRRLATSPLADHPANAVGGKTEAQSIRPDKAIREHLTDEREGRMPQIMSRPHAVDKSRYGHMDACAGGMRCPDDAHRCARVSRQGKAFHPSAQDFKLSALHQGIELIRHLRSQSMAMHLPPGPQVPEEALLFQARQRTPICGGYWPKSVDDVAPVVPAESLLAHGTAHGAKVCHNVRREGRSRR